LETVTPKFSLTVADKAVSEIRLLSAIARANGSLLSLQDVVTLTDVNLTEEQLEARWHASPNLAKFYRLEDGFVFDRELEDETARPAILDERKERRARAESYTNLAKEFVSFFARKESCLVAISGSTSYHSVSETDDLDFFCITKPGSLWVFLTTTLLLSRVFRLFKRKMPRACFSYAVDQAFAEQDFAASSDPLFARDALTTVVIRGGEFYTRLLKKSSWISNYFPRLYRQRTRGYVPEEGTESIEERSAPSPAWRFLNLLLCHLIGRYISAKSFMLNLKFKKQGMSSSLFAVKIGPDHCIFESARYSHLRTMYRSFNTKPSGEELIPS
jgi:hypothetical protein